MWKQNMKSFSNETLNFFLRKFWQSYMLDFAKTLLALRILLQKSTGNLAITELWALEIHVLVNMLLCSSHFTEVHWVYNGSPTIFCTRLILLHVCYSFLLKFLSVIVFPKSYQYNINSIHINIYSIYSIIGYNTKIIM